MADAGDTKPMAWVETVGAILLALTSLGTTWSSFEVSQWSGRSGEKGGAAGGLERKANLLRIEGQQVQSVQAQMFMNYVSAHLSGNAALERFYVDRFPPEAKKAFEAWIALKPFETPSAPPHPFVPSLYEMRNSKEIEQSLAESARLGEEARVAGNVAHGYLTNTILLATVLFFVGITSRFSQQKIRLGCFCFAAALFVFAALRLAVFPKLI